jgi:hypothetical protein
MHPSIRPYLEYFSLPRGYGPQGLRWSHDGEALETDEATWRFSHQVADFLDGFASLRPLPHFAHVLECLRLLDMYPPAACPDPERFKLVAHTFRRLNNSARNAGALFAHLCATIPPAAHVPPGGGKSLAHWLTHSPSLGFLHPTGPGNPEIPGLAAHAFHERLAARLREMTDFAVRHWLRHGTGPHDLPAELIADQMDRKPPTMAEFMDAAVKDRARLGGAVPLVRHFVSALSLPPRRRTPPKLPIGGYADVTSRGDPARLLPSQLALDPDEFVRRFAENELLFFRREDPHERKQEHLALVVDQGVLTWGPVRLALGAAVLAFGRLAARRKLAVTVRFGSAPAERFTPPTNNPDRFGEALEASDLSPQPGHALAEELLDPSAPERDVVLLTHPRNLGEPEVRRLAKLTAKGCRLFALTATEDGQVELVGLREGGPVPINQFRVDFNPRAPKLAPPPAANVDPWSGDVEPIPFPFRFGLTNRVADVAFDVGGERLMAASVDGFLHVWTLADGSVEVLPRGWADGVAMKSVQAVIGVGNGFAVCGRWGNGLAVVHYDWPTHTATLHHLLADAGDLESAWYGFPHSLSVVLKAGPVYRAVDLGTGGVFPDMKDRPDLVVRAQAAAAAARILLLPPPAVPVVNYDHSQAPTAPFLIHESGTGQIRVVLPHRNTSFLPQTDGRPRFRTFAPVAQWAGATLALFATQPQTWSLYDLDNDGAALTEYPPATFGVAKLSPDGRFFVRQTASGMLAVTEPAAQKTILLTRSARCHSNLEVRLGLRCLGMSVGPVGCLLDWSAGPLRVTPGRSAADGFGWRAETEFRTTRSDRGRFVSHVRSDRWEVALDCFGQIAFLREGRAVCMFIFRRGKLAAWTPDGVRYGPAELTGGPQTPGALERLGKVLWDLTGRGDFH